MKVVKQLADLFADVSVKTAKKAQSCSSIFCFYQPKEPDMNKIPSENHKS